MKNAGNLGKGLYDSISKLQASFEEKKARDAEELKERQKQTDFNELNNVIPLPSWPEQARGVPNCVLRGSLFAAIKGSIKNQCYKELIHESDKMTIKYTGIRLSQSDLDVWEGALHLAREKCLGNKVHFTEHSFLKLLDRKTTKFEYQWLDSVLTKLNACTVHISYDGKTYSGSLIDEAYRDDKEGKQVIVLNSKLSRLFESGHTWVSWEERKRIGKRKPLAQWLHGYISTHAKWYPHRVEKIKELSGSETKELKRFKHALKEALKHLRELKIIEEFRIDEKELVYITRKLSKSQQNYLDSK